MLQAFVGQKLVTHCLQEPAGLPGGACPVLSRTFSKESRCSIGRAGLPRGIPAKPQSDCIHLAVTEVLHLIDMKSLLLIFNPFT